MDPATETPPDPPPAAGSGRRWRISFPRWLVAVVLVAVLAGAGYGGWSLLQRHETDVAGQQALAAAEKYVLTLTNFDSVFADPAVEKDMDYLLDGATGEYKDMYARSQAKLLKLQVEKKAAGRGTIVDSTVKSATKDKAVVVLLVDQSVTNADNPDPQLDRSRVRVTMYKVDGRWLVGYLEAL
ncbi:MAG TPA: Mce protein [Mycobacterium sp.]|nr:Mce protein [Mycobacterium sp.]